MTVCCVTDVRGQFEALFHVKLFIDVNVFHIFLTLSSFHTQQDGNLESEMSHPS